MTPMPRRNVTKCFAWFSAMTFVAAGALATFAPQAHAADKPAKPAKAAKAAKGEAGDVTLSGEMMCGKCVLKKAEACQNVLKVTNGGKETLYWLEHNTVAKENHGQVCGGSAKATVKGKVADKDGKKVLTPTEIKYES